MKCFYLALFNYTNGPKAWKIWVDCPKLPFEKLKPQEFDFRFSWTSKWNLKVWISTNAEPSIDNGNEQHTSSLYLVPVKIKFNLSKKVSHILMFSGHLLRFCVVSCNWVVAWFRADLNERTFWKRTRLFWKCLHYRHCGLPLFVELSTDSVISTSCQFVLM